MLRSSFNLGLGWVILLLCFSALRAESATPDQALEAFDFYVSPTGNDQWSGGRAEPNEGGSDGPFVSLEKARDAVRESRARNPEGKYRVALRGGTYRLAETLVFGMEDSASGEGSTTFAAYPGETPVLSSGIPLSGWKKLDSLPQSATATASGHLWVTRVPPPRPNNVLTLYDGFERLPRARGRGFEPPHGWPEDGNGKGPCNVFFFPPGIIERYLDFRGAELLVMPTANYEMNILPIDYVDREKGFGVTKTLASRAMGPMQFHSETMWIENRLEDLDQPGEWVFDSVSRNLYLWPKGAEPGDGILAPTLTELVRVEGDIQYAAPQDFPVRNLIFSGLTFAHGERMPWQGQTGWDIQHGWEQFDSPTAMLRFRGAEGCGVEACRFVASGGAGLRMDLHCQHNLVRDCEFGHIGGAAVLLAGYGPGTKDVNRENRILNNWIHHIGETYWATPAIFAWQSGSNLIANNTIHNTPYSGIVIHGRISLKRLATSGSVRTVRWHELDLKEPLAATWEQREPYLHARLNRVERNDITAVMERLGDGNGIYVSGAGKGNLIKENFVHHIDSDHLVQAIRCDDDQYDTVIEKNVVYKVRSMHEAIVLKGRNDVINNFLIDIIPSRTKIDPKWVMRGYIGLKVYPVTGSRIQRNIVYCPRPEYTPFHVSLFYGTGEGPRLEDCETDNNLYFCPVDAEWGARHLNQARPSGIETHSLSTDPMFVDVEGGDLRLKPDSPALGLGIENIDLSQVGVRPGNPYKPMD